MGMADANKRINLAAPSGPMEQRPGHPKSVRTRRPPPTTTTVAKEGPATGLSDAASAVGIRGSAMMERFLPAAHAVAVASPLSTFRAFDGEKRRLPLQHIPTNHLQQLLPPRDKNDDDAESDVHSTHGFASKRCGLLPTRCVKLLNRSRGSQRETNPLLRRSRSGQQRHTGGGHDPDTVSPEQSWEELYIKSLLRSSRGGLTAPAAAVASELDRTVREVYRRRGGGGAVQPKASHLGLLLVLDRSHEACRGSSARNAGETALLLPHTKSSPNAGKKSRLLLEDKAAASPGREIVLSPQAMLPALPLPKSPSESWLSRALPSVCNRPPPATSFLGLHVHSRKHAPSPWCSIDPSAKAVVDRRARQRQMLAHHLQT